MKWSWAQSEHHELQVKILLKTILRPTIVLVLFGKVLLTIIRLPRTGSSVSVVILLLLKIRVTLCLI